MHVHPRFPRFRPGPRPAPAQGLCPKCGKANLVRTFKKRVDEARVEAAYDCPACEFTSDVIELARAT